MRKQKERWNMNKCVGCSDIMDQQQQKPIRVQAKHHKLTILQTHQTKGKHNNLKPQEKTEKKNIKKKPSNNYKDHHNKKKWGMKRSNQPWSFAQSLPNWTQKNGKCKGKMAHKVEQEQQQIPYQTKTTNSEVWEIPERQWAEARKNSSNGYLFKFSYT